MNPNIETSVGMGLPEPQPADGVTRPEQSQQGAFNHESRPASPEVTSAQSMPQATSVTNYSTPMPQSAAVAPILSVAAPATANDDDVIDKEWVVKAKQIVEASRQDPYLQTRQLAAFKADYLQKRYNKTVKLSE